MPDFGKVLAQINLRVERARASYGLVDIVVRTFKRHSEDDGGFYAAALTYYVFFSMFPLMIFATAILGVVTHVYPDVEKDLLEEGLASFPLIGSVIDPEVLQSIRRAAGRLALLSIGLALYSGTGAVVALGHALNKIHRVENEGNFFVKRLDALKWLALFALMVLGSLVVSGWARWAPGFLATVLALPVGFSLNLAIFATAFKFLPRMPRSWADVLPGALVAAAIFELLKYVGTLYISRGAEARSATFGAFATAAGLLVVSYLLAQITLLTAQVNAVLAERRLTRQSLVE
ncbi:MAG TPA: YihY/virulence factor BrkB family protein, partial [Actinomycetota bacterium]|nr:YihY/virulence factor BrkB family protein [Actinomycetota bacterium]